MGEKGEGVSLGAVLENELFSLVRLVLELGRGMEMCGCQVSRVRASCFSFAFFFFCTNSWFPGPLSQGLSFREERFSFYG